jgi:hypothetical protein
VTEGQEDRMLIELFRQKLENAEVMPSPSASRELFGRLGRREFMHFNPARFNIWYACGIIAAGAALALILSSGDGGNEKAIPSDSESFKTIITDEPGAVIAQSENQNPAGDIRSNEGERTGRSKKSSGILNMTGADNDFPAPRTNVPSRSDVKVNISENGLLQKVAGEKDKLRNVKQTSSLIESSVYGGCCPLKVAFVNKALSYNSCRWSFGDGGYSVERNPEWIFDVEGEYEITLQVFDSEGLQSVSSAVITVYPKPVARFEIVAGNTVMPGDEINFVNYSADAVRYSWDFGDGDNSDLYQPRHTYEKYGNYDISLVVTSQNGCTDTLVVSNAFASSGNFIKFPNAFIPNPGGPSSGYYSQSSDEVAHIFHPVFSGVSEYQLRIFSKLGVLIFESNDINIGWDGYFKGQLSEQGVYIWKVRGTFINGEPFTKMGDLTLLKY